MQNKPKVVNRGINTDSIISDLAGKAETGQQYTLKERNVEHHRIKDSNDLLRFYTFGQEIGQGGFGTVLSAKERTSEKEWAIKIVVKSMAGPNLKFIQREIQILKMVTHPHIIYLDKVYESPRKIYMVLERCSGELFTVYKQQKPFQENLARNIINQILSAVAYLHKHDIVHRDLKMENVLMAKNPKDSSDKYYTKLTDFGLSIMKSSTGVDSMLRERCGTPVYMAPEMIMKHSYSQLCDVWAVGIMLYMLLVGEYPFHSADDNDIANQILHKEPNFPNNLNISSVATNLVLSLLQKEPFKRIAAVEALEHPWVRGETGTTAHVQENILDTMTKWRAELMLPRNSEDEQNKGLLVRKRSIVRRPGAKLSGKQPVPMSITNIKFNRPTPKSSMVDTSKHAFNPHANRDIFSTATRKTDTYAVAASNSNLSLESCVSVKKGYKPPSKALHTKGGTSSIMPSIGMRNPPKKTN